MHPFRNFFLLLPKCFWPQRLLICCLCLAIFGFIVPSQYVLDLNYNDEQENGLFTNLSTKFNRHPNPIPLHVFKGGGTLKREGSPYLVHEHLEIPQDVTVIIEPGVELQFLPGKGITVRGTIIAKGLPSNRIRFTKHEKLDFINKQPTPSSSSNKYSTRVRSVRLIEGTDTSNGIIQLLYNHKWRSICTQTFNISKALHQTTHEEYGRYSRHWKLEDVIVACRGAGYENGTFVSWSKPMIDMNYITLLPICNGDETTLENCKSTRNNAKIAKGTCGDDSMGQNEMVLKIRCWNNPCWGAASCQQTNTKSLVGSWKGITFLNSTYQSTLNYQVPATGENGNSQFNSQNFKSPFPRDFFRPPSFFNNMDNGDMRGYDSSYRQSYKSSADYNNQYGAAINWLNNRSSSALSYVDIYFAGMDEYGLHVPALEVKSGYAPHLKSIDIRHSYFTALAYDEVQGYPVIESSNITRNDGDGISISVYNHGNFSIINSIIEKNSGRGINYQILPSSVPNDSSIRKLYRNYYNQEIPNNDDNNRDFCSKPFLGINQVYPITTWGNRYTNCKQIFVTKSDRLVVHFNEIYSAFENRTEKDQADVKALSFIEIWDGWEPEINKVIARIRLDGSGSIASQSIQTKSQKLSIKISSQEALIPKSYHAYFNIKIDNVPSYDLHVQNCRISDNALQGIYMAGHRNVIFIDRSNISSNHYSAGLHVPEGVGDVVIRDSLFQLNVGAGTSISCQGCSLNVTRSLFQLNDGFGIRLTHLDNTKNDLNLINERDDFVNDSNELERNLIKLGDEAYTYSSNIFQGNRKISYVSMAFNHFQSNRLSCISISSSNSIPAYLDGTGERSRNVIQLTFNRFIANLDHSINMNLNYASKDKDNTGASIEVDINNNTFVRNERSAIKLYYPFGGGSSWDLRVASDFYTSIESNYFTENKKGAITILSSLSIQNFKFNEAKREYVQANSQLNQIHVRYNTFIRNTGTYVLYIEYHKTAAHVLNTSISYNYFIDNVVRNRETYYSDIAPSVSAAGTYTRSRSMIKAVVILAGCPSPYSSIIIDRNHFANHPTTADWEIGTRCTDRTLTFHAPYNWFQTSPQVVSIDQLHVNQIYDKVFDRRFRWNLAHINIHPFLRTSNLNGPSSMTPYTREFVRQSPTSADHVVGGLVESRVYLKRDKSPYTVMEDIYVSSRGELIIEPGVELRFQDGIGIFIEGKLYAVSSITSLSSVGQYYSIDNPYNDYYLHGSPLHQNPDQIINVDGIPPILFGRKQHSQHNHYKLYPTDMDKPPLNILNQLNESEIEISTNQTLPTTTTKTIANKELIDWNSLLSLDSYSTNEGINLNNLTLVPLEENMLNDNIKLDATDDRLHVRINGTWGTVCNKGWSLLNSGLVCSTLGKVIDIDNWLIPVTQIQMGRGMKLNNLPYPTTIHLTHVVCDMSDDDILTCKHDLDTLNVCTHDQDVALKCIEPKWAGIRLGFFAKPSDMVNVTISHTGTFDLETGETSPALRIDYNVHKLESLRIRNNLIGIRNMYNDWSSINPYHHNLIHSNVESNLKCGLLLNSPGFTILQSTITDHNVDDGIGILYDPYISREDIINTLYLPFPTTLHDTSKDNNVDMGIILIMFPNILPLANFQSPKNTFRKTVPENDNLYLYFKSNQYHIIQSHPFKLLELESITADITTNQGNVFQFQFFGIIPPNIGQNGNGTFELRITERHYPFEQIHSFHTLSDLHRFPFNSLTWNVKVSCKIYISNWPQDMDFNFVLQIRSVKNYPTSYFTPKIEIINSTISRNSDGIIMKYYDSQKNSDLFQSILDDTAYDMEDTHLRYGNTSLVMRDCNVNENIGIALTIYSPHRRNMISHPLINLNVKIIRNTFIKNGKIMETIDEYPYDSNTRLRISIINNNFYTNFAGISTTFPYFINTSSLEYDQSPHSFFLLNNTFNDNRNFSVILAGNFANITMLQNTFQDNTLFPSHHEPYQHYQQYYDNNKGLSLIVIRDSGKAYRILNNSFVKNKADTIVDVRADSNGDVSPEFFLFQNGTPLESKEPFNIIQEIKFNYFRHNFPISKPASNDYYTSSSSSSSTKVIKSFVNSVISIFGSTLNGLDSIRLNRNVFQYNNYQYLLTCGIHSSEMTMSHEKTQILWNFNGQYNYWDTPSEGEVIVKIYDWRNNNAFVRVKWYPYLLYPDMDTSQFSQSFYRDIPLYETQSEPDSKFNSKVDSRPGNAIGGYLNHDLTLILKPETSFYLVTHDITIPRGRNLTIHPGVNLKFLPHVGILVYGNLICLGTRDERIIFDVFEDKSIPDHNTYYNYPGSSSTLDSFNAKILSTYNPITRNSLKPKSLSEVYRNLGSHLPAYIRVTDGQSSSEGYLEYFNSTFQSWYPYCDVAFNPQNAKVVCKTLGFSADDSYFFHGAKPHKKTAEAERLKSPSPHPLDCYGYEKDWKDCTPRSIGASEKLTLKKQTFCDGNNYLYVRCKVKSRIYRDKWGGIRFLGNAAATISKTHFSPPPLRQQNDLSASYSSLKYVTIRNAGKLYNYGKSSALLITGQTNLREVKGLIIENCASHGVALFNLNNDFELRSQSSSNGNSDNHNNNNIIVRKNKGIGLVSTNILPYHDDQNNYYNNNNGKAHSKYHPTMHQSKLQIDSSLFGASPDPLIQNICHGPVVQELPSYTKSSFLIGYKSHDQAGHVSHFKRCLRIFQSKNILGFKLLNANTTTNYDGDNGFKIWLYKAIPFNKFNLIAELNTSNHFLSKTVFNSDSNMIGLKFELTKNQVGDESQMWIGQIMVIPSLPINRPTTHTFEGLILENNDLGAMNFYYSGQVAPNLNVQHNKIYRNGFHSYNFTSPWPIVSFHLQNVQNLLFTNNYVGSNVGKVMRLIMGSDSNVYPFNGILRNNLISDNYYGTCLEINSLNTHGVNQFIEISDSQFMDNYSPASELMSIEKCTINITRNLISNNVAIKHILTLKGFEDTLSTEPTYVSHNVFYNNTVYQHTHCKFDQGCNHKPGTILSQDSYQVYADNQFENYNNNFELIAGPKQKWGDIWHQSIMARNNYWGSNYLSAVQGKVFDEEDEFHLIAVNKIPFTTKNNSMVATCSPGWSPIGENCYLYFGGVMGFKEAVDFCNHHGGTLPYLITDPQTIVNFYESRQYQHDVNLWTPKIIWVQGNPGGYLENYGKCYAIQNEVVGEVSCDSLHPFVCEISPITGLFVAKWFKRSYNVLLMLVVILAIALVSCFMICWIKKSRNKKKEAFIRRNSLRSSIRSNRSLRSITTGNGTLNGSFDPARPRSRLTTSPSYYSGYSCCEYQHKPRNHHTDFDDENGEDGTENKQIKATTNTTNTNNDMVGMGVGNGGGSLSTYYDIYSIATFNTNMSDMNGYREDRSNILNDMNQMNSKLAPLTSTERDDVVSDVCTHIIAPEDGNNIYGTGLNYCSNTDIQQQPLTGSSRERKLINSGNFIRLAEEQGSNVSDSILTNKTTPSQRTNQITSSFISKCANTNQQLIRNSNKLQSTVKRPPTIYENLPFTQHLQATHASHYSAGRMEDDEKDVTLTSGDTLNDKESSNSTFDSSSEKSGTALIIHKDNPISLQVPPEDDINSDVKSQNINPPNNTSYVKTFADILYKPIKSMISNDHHHDTTATKRLNNVTTTTKTPKRENIYMQPFDTLNSSRSLSHPSYQNRVTASTVGAGDSAYHSHESQEHNLDNNSSSPDLEIGSSYGYPINRPIPINTSTNTKSYFHANKNYILPAVAEHSTLKSQFKQGHSEQKLNCNQHKSTHNYEELPSNDKQLKCHKGGPDISFWSIETNPSSVTSSLYPVDSNTPLDSSTTSNHDRSLTYMITSPNCINNLPYGTTLNIQSNNNSYNKLTKESDV